MVCGGVPVREYPLMHVDEVQDVDEISISTFDVAVEHVIVLFTILDGGEFDSNSDLKIGSKDRI